MATAHADAAGSGPRRLPNGLRIALVCLALMIVPGVLAGGSLLDAAKALAFYAGWVLLPGLALAALLGGEDDEFVAAGMALVLGTVLVALFGLVCRATGLHGALLVWPLSALGFRALLRRRGHAPLAPGSAGGGTWAFLALLVLVLVRVPTGFSGAVDGWYLLVQDLVFHGGNAAELLKQGPLIDPRVAWRPLNYHLLSHAPVAAMRVVTGVPISDLFRFWFLGFYPLVLVLLVFGLARGMARSAWGGAVAVLVLVLHQDPARGLFDQHNSYWSFLSDLNLGIFLSPTTCLGLALLAAIARVLLRWIDPAQRVGPREIVALALLAMAASMAKGSVMPPAIAGAGLAFLVQSLRERRWNLRWLGATLVLLLASLPATLYLSLGPGSYAGAMFHVVPWATVTSSRAGTWLAAALSFSGNRPFLEALLVAVPWLPGFLGLGGIGALAWLCARASLRGLGAWILGTFLAGIGAGLMLLAPGDSQLFFAYDAQMVLALPGGVGTVELWRRRRSLAIAVALLALPFVVNGVVGVARSIEVRAIIARDGPELWPQWCQGAAWLRDNTDPAAVLVASQDGLLLTQFAERRVLLAATPYTPEAHATRWKEVGGRWRLGSPSGTVFANERQTCETALKRGDPTSLARLRAFARHEGELYLVYDKAEVLNVTKVELGQVGETRLDASPVLERVFKNDAMAIYRALK